MRVRPSLHFHYLNNRVWVVVTIITNAVAMWGVSLVRKSVPLIKGLRADIFGLEEG